MTESHKKLLKHSKMNVKFEIKKISKIQNKWKDKMIRRNGMCIQHTRVTGGGVENAINANIQNPSQFRADFTHKIELELNTRPTNELEVTATLRQYNSECSHNI